jgi:hypothetical protein
MSVSEAEVDLSADEQRGLELIKETGGIHQSDFWKELDISSRKGLEFRLLMAGDLLSPFIGEEEVDPQSDSFSQWLMNLAYEE